MNKKYICLVLLMTTCLMQGMKEASTTQTKISVGKKVKTCKKDAGVSCEDLVLKKQPITWSSQQRASFKTVNNIPDTPRQLKTEDPKPLSAVDIIYAQDFLYILGELKDKQRYIFSKKIYNTKKSDENDFKEQRNNLATRLFYKNPYLFFQSDAKETIQLKDLKANTPLVNSIVHHTPILSVGTINKYVFSGSLWPSIKKSHIPKDKVQFKTESFIDNAYLLACQDNGMIIAKIDEKDNTQFWIWRRLFKKENDVRVTLYALFFEPNSIQNINKKMIEEALNEAYEQQKLNYNNNTYTKGNITAITLAKNVVLTAAEQNDPFKKFPKAAISKNTAIVIHTQRYPENNNEAFSHTNPAVSIAYKNTDNSWQISLSNHFDSWIKKKKQIADYYIRLPYLDEIKDIYITKVDKQPLALLITQTDIKGYCADGVYAIPLTGQEQNALAKPFWYVDIQITTYTNTTQDTNNKTWRSSEKIVASTFDYEKKNLFLITESLDKNKKQELITININNLKNDIPKT